MKWIRDIDEDANEKYEINWVAAVVEAHTFHFVYSLSICTHTERQYVYFVNWHFSTSLQGARLPTGYERCTPRQDSQKKREKNEVLTASLQTLFFNRKAEKGNGDTMHFNLAFSFSPDYMAYFWIFQFLMKAHKREKESERENMFRLSMRPINFGPMKFNGHFRWSVACNRAAAVVKYVDFVFAFDDDLCSKPDSAGCDHWT